MKWLDKLTTSFSRNLVHRTSRRHVLTRLGTLAMGGAALPLLPIARAAAQGGYPGVAAQSTGNPEDPGDPTQCEYWRYCAIDGFLCACCGGTQNSCPPGSEMSPLTWIGTCQNPADGKHYIISYNDCCGKTSCGRCACNRNEGDTPLYRAQSNNDTDWCIGTKSSVYTCSTAVILGVSLEQGG